MNNYSLFLLLLLNASSALFSVQKELDHPTLEQLLNTDKIDISLSFRRDINTNNVNMESWLTMVKATDNLIQKCYACPKDKDSELYEEVCNTIQFIRGEHYDHGKGVERFLYVSGQTTQTQEDIIINGNKFILLNTLNDNQLDELFSLYNQSDKKIQSPDELNELLRNSLFFILIDSSNQKIIGFIRAVTDYVRIAMVLDLTINLEYSGNELDKLLVSKILEHPKIKSLPKIESDLVK